MQDVDLTVFSPRVARYVGLAALSSLLAAFCLLLSPGEDRSVASAGADGYSRSAIGHFGLLQLLRDLGEPVLQIRGTYSLANCGLLVVAEPRPDSARDRQRLARLVADAAHTLVALPKRQGSADAAAPHWVSEVSLVSSADVQDVLDQVDEWTDAMQVRALRVRSAGGWHAEHGWPHPTLTGPVQLLDTDTVEPLIRCDEGTLLGRVGSVHVLSDPDLLANHALHRGDNAELVLAMLRHLRGDGAFVFDETMHGHLREASVWTAAGQFPLVLVPAHLLLVLALTLWIASGRFGRPLPVPAAIGAGKGFLIDNIAALLRRGGHHAPSLRRYCRNCIRRGAERLHAPPGLSDDQCRDWLLGRMGGGALRAELTDLLERVGSELKPSESVATARAVRSLIEKELTEEH